MGNIIQIWKLAEGNPAPEPVILEPTPASFDDATKRVPGGGYTTLRTFHGIQVVRLEDHFWRLQKTAALSEHATNRTWRPINWENVRIGLRRALSNHPAAEKRVRIILDLTAKPGELYFLIDTLVTPSEDEYRNGVRIVTRVMHRQNPKAKLTGFIDQASAVRSAIPEGINEVLMIGEKGEALEGLSSNFFGIRHGIVFTAEDGVLDGITRATVLGVINHRQIPLNLNPVSMRDLTHLDEAFLTSASRGVLPVTAINGNPVGKGVPGEMTLEIQAEYLKEIEGLLETV